VTSSPNWPNHSFWSSTSMNGVVSFEHVPPPTRPGAARGCRVGQRRPVRLPGPLHRHLAGGPKMPAWPTRFMITPPC
jgi:hypothetical protein